MGGRKLQWKEHFAGSPKSWVPVLVSVFVFFPCTSQFIFKEQFSHLYNGITILFLPTRRHSLYLELHVHMLQCYKGGNVIPRTGLNCFFTLHRWFWRKSSIVLVTAQINYQQDLPTLHFRWLRKKVLSPKAHETLSGNLLWEKHHQFSIKIW